MNFRPRLLVPILLVLVAVACGGVAATSGSGSVDGRSYELQITHRMSAGGMVLYDGQWTEQDFSEVEGGGRYRLSLTADEQAFELQSLTGAETYRGHLEQVGVVPADLSLLDYTRYVIDEGAFAGGRLVIWQAGRELRAEVTYYGSGLPVLRSERGDLVELV